MQSYLAAVEASSLPQPQKQMLGLLVASCDDRGVIFGTTADIVEGIRVSLGLRVDQAAAAFASFEKDPGPLLIEATTADYFGCGPRPCLHILGVRR
jgi:hypothetical protein